MKLFQDAGLDKESNLIFLAYISPNSVATVLTVRVKAPHLIEVVAGASGIFPVNFHTKWLL